jgi:hypothetical protein
MNSSGYTEDKLPSYVGSLVVSKLMPEMLGNVVLLWQDMMLLGRAILIWEAKKLEV